MRETQRHALALFKSRGFDEVTIDEIASDLGMAASTVYRHFGTKENLVLWDEHDPAIDAALASRLGRQPALSAIRDALIDSLAGRYSNDLRFQLERIAYIYATPQVHAAARQQEAEQRDELAEALADTLSEEAKATAPVIAGAAMVAVDVAIDRWQQEKAKRSLANHLTEAFAALEELGSLR